jgi:hypothetical protein
MTDKKNINQEGITYMAGKKDINPYQLVAENEEKRVSALELKARKKESLILPVLFDILDYKPDICPIYNDDEKFEQDYSRRIMGRVPKKILKVKSAPLNEKIESSKLDSSKIEELIFYGFDSFEQGDKIRAYIHKYKIEKGKLITTCGCCGEIREEFFIERDFNKREVVSRIDKFYRNGDFYELRGIDTNGKEVW